MQKSTDELTNQIKKTDNIEDFINSNKTNLLTKSISELLNDFLERKNLSRGEVAKESDVHRTYVYEIFNGKKVPSRDKMIAVGFGLKLDFDEMQKLLKQSGYRELYSRDSRDSVIIFALNKGKNLLECNELLYSLSEELIK